MITEHHGKKKSKDSRTKMNPLSGALWFPIRFVQQEFSTAKKE
jgi:hypothetical protein